MWTINWPTINSVKTFMDCYLFLINWKWLPNLTISGHQYFKKGDQFIAILSPQA
jgi:hypothetical protein